MCSRTIGNSVSILRASLLALLLSAGLAACGGNDSTAPVAVPPPPPPPAPPPPVTGKGTMNSGPVQVSPDGRTVWVVNPETNGGKGSVTIIDVSLAVPTTVEFTDPSLDEPRNLAFSPDGRLVVVANSGGRRGADAQHESGGES